MPEVAICTENIIIPALGAGILFQGERLEYLPEYCIQHLSVCSPPPIQPPLWNIAVLDRNRLESDMYDTVHCRHLVDLRRQIAKYDEFRRLFLVGSKIRELFSVGHEDHGNQCIPHWALTWRQMAWYYPRVSLLTCVSHLQPTVCNMV